MAAETTKPEVEVISPQIEVRSRLSEEEIDLLAAHKHNFDDNPLAYFVPTGAQEQWIALTGNHDDSQPRTKLFSAANKVAKTSSTVAKLASVIYGPQNRWFDYPIYRKWPYPKTVWIDSEDSTLREILIPEMHRWFPKGTHPNGKPYYKVKSHSKSFDYHWICQGLDGEWHIYIKTYDTAASKLESALLGLMIFSEPPPRDHYIAVPARMPAGGMVWMEFTPLSNSAWIHDDLLEDVEIIDEPIPHVQRGKTERIDIVYADIESACKTHGIRGLWEHKYVEALITEYDPDEAEARAHGKFSALKGRVYKGWKDHALVIDKRVLPANTQLWMVVDPHERRPSFVQYWAILPEGEWRYELIYEFPKFRKGHGFETLKESDETVGEFCARLLKFEDELGMPIVRRIMDPRMGSKAYPERKDLTMQKLWAEHGISCQLPRRTFLDVGHDAVKLAIKSESFRVWRSCGNTTRAFKNYKFEKDPNRKDGKDLVIDVEEKWKDPMDLVRYFFVENPKYDFRYRAEGRVGWRGRLSKRRGSKVRTCGNYFG